MFNAIAASVISILLVLNFWPNNKTDGQETQAPAILKVREMGSLVALNVNYSNVIDVSDRITKDIPVVNWHLEFGSTRVLYVAKGDCLIGVDLTKANYEESRVASKSIDLVLPLPKIISAKLSQDTGKNGSYFFTVDHSGMSKVIPGTKRQTDAMDRAIKVAQKDLEKQCQNAEYIESAKTTTDKLLSSIIKGTSDWQVRILWAKA